MVRNLMLTAAADAACAAVVGVTVFGAPLIMLAAATLASDAPAASAAPYAVAMKAGKAAAAAAGSLFAATLVLDWLRRIVRAPWWTGTVFAAAAPIAAACFLLAPSEASVRGRAISGATLALLWVVYWHVYLITYGMMEYTAEAVAQQGDAG
jgi:hypothetical protein